ncbi:MAG: hypothetical protein PHV36_12390 [Elusimicrobiales bacterium]|nr:hypothetical protein [Elusimicrobiales bacterium]
MSTKLAIAALTMAALSFVHLFGVEKAGMAVAFGTMALKDPSLTPHGQKLAMAAIITGLAYLAVVAGVFIFHMPMLNELASHLAK